MTAVDPGPPGEAPPSPPFLLHDPAVAARTGLVVAPHGDIMPAAVWIGPVPAHGLDPAMVAALADRTWQCALLSEHAMGWFGRPGLSGHRLNSAGRHPAAGRDWSAHFRPSRVVHGGSQARVAHEGSQARVAHEGSQARVEAVDEVAGLALVTEIEAVPGGAIRGRHTLTNTGEQPYVLDSLEVVFPLPGEVAETLDFTGRQMHERVPQRRVIADGLWLREGRRGHTGHDSATVLVAGTAGFGFGAGRVWVHRVERLRSGLTTIGGGELLLPGEVTLDGGQAYATPWVYLAAAADGLDGLASMFHGSTCGRPSPSITTWAG